MGQSQSSRRTKAEQEQFKLQNTTQTLPLKATGPVSKPAPKFKVSPPLKQMMKAPAGRLYVAPTDEYVFLKYSKAASDICDALQKLVVTFNEMKARYEDGKPINNNMLVFRIDLEEVHRHYDTFLRESAYKVDQLVQYRKDMSCKGFTDLLFFKFSYEKMLDARPPQFDEVKEMIDKQILYSTDLLDHVVKSFDRQNLHRYNK
ncbi:hypothetical protein GCK72_016327 [Caenorhabditis remanei]|uniref:Uncharacterized protein n=1 Tax=Caenorhabditis remanei TaxID=31234 RepID=A0A6A5GWK8_CAERE|nr:hypothetical protein GCK72_016327 [Caenorhabditis remanei]KAF1759860.1 hypothetical protein GCK72_016327 [Caenorhabditis remanei]